tara:strand:+ start:196 stop:468 length:273 start_codon:yes stop_codon:yes gene_type:complete
MKKLYNYIDNNFPGFMLGFTDNILLVFMALIGFIIDNGLAFYTLLFSALGNAISDYIGAWTDKTLKQYANNIFIGALIPCIPIFILGIII